MIDVLKNSEGLVNAYCEWTLVNEKGEVTNGGKFVYIYDLWAHKRNGSIPKLIKIIYNKTPTAKWVYWYREKYNGRIKMFPKKQFERRIK